MRHQRTKQPRREPVQPRNPQIVNFIPKPIVIENSTQWRTQDLRRLVEMARWVDPKYSDVEFHIPDKIEFRTAAENRAYEYSAKRYGAATDRIYICVVDLPANRVSALQLVNLLDTMFSRPVPENENGLRKDMARIRALGKHPIQHRNRRKRVYAAKQPQLKG